MLSLPPPAWISTPAQLKLMVEELGSQPRLAVDSESNSLHAYREQVCLLQLSTPQSDFVVDPLALPDLTKLAPLFADPHIEKVFHAAEYDLICLERDYGFKTINIFDTMQSARILGYPQVGLDALLELKFRLKVDKRYQKADWALRPLSPEMLNYARMDTHYLLNLRDCLQQELVGSGLLELAQEEFVRLAHSHANGKVAVPAWQRVNGTQNFNPQQLAVLKELCDWRESLARQLNRPMFKILDEQRLTALVLLSPRSPQELERVLTPRQAQRYGSEILRVLQQAQGASPLQRPHPPRPNGAFLQRFDLLNQWRKQTAQNNHLEADIILPKAWMHLIAEKNPQSLQELTALLTESPYRLEKYGPEILAALAPNKKKTDPDKV